MLRDGATLLDIARATRLIVEFRQGMDRAAFLADAKTQSAILHQLLVLGEAAKRLSATFTSQHPEMPWRLMARMRDRLIHGYDAVDLDQVWYVVEGDIARLLCLIEPLLPRDDTEPRSRT